MFKATAFMLKTTTSENRSSAIIIISYDISNFQINISVVHKHTNFSTQHCIYINFKMTTITKAIKFMGEAVSQAKKVVSIVELQ